MSHFRGLASATEGDNKDRVAITIASHHATPSALAIYTVLMLSTLPVTQAHAQQLDTLSHGGLIRNYHVHVPAAYDSTNATPVVFAFHGGFGSSDNIEQQSGLSIVADEENFIIVYPNGTGTIPTWNGGECCGYAAREGIDDVGFVDKVLDRIIEDYTVDARRVYATGISNGGAMTYHLACELGERFAAYAPVAATYRNASCMPMFAEPVIHFHSSRDDNVPIEGGVGNGPSNLDWLPLDSTLAHFALYNGCAGATGEQLSDSLFVKKWNDCGFMGDVHLFLVSDGGHSWPGGTKTIIGDSVSTAVDASREMWKFFEQHFNVLSTPGVEESPGGKTLITSLEVYPNPATEAVSIEIESTATAVTADIYDLLGRHLRRLEVPASTGVRRVFWDGRSADGVIAPPGHYFVRARADGEIVTRQLMVSR